MLPGARQRIYQKEPQLAEPTAETSIHRQWKHYASAPGVSRRVLRGTVRSNSHRASINTRRRPSDVRSFQCFPALLYLTLPGPLLRARKLGSSCAEKMHRDKGRREKERGKRRARSLRFQLSTYIRPHEMSSLLVNATVSITPPNQEVPMKKPRAYTRTNTTPSIQFVLLKFPLSVERSQAELLTEMAGAQPEAEKALAE